MKLKVTSMILAGYLVFAFGGGIALARGGGDEVEVATTQDSSDKTETQQQSPTSGRNSVRSTDNKEAEIEHSGKLEAAKLKVCQVREKTIDNTMKRIAERGTKQIDTLSTITTRVEAFYVKQGKTLGTYDSLVANVNSKKAAAQAAVDQVKSQSAIFKCDGTDPKGAAATFKASLKKERAALKEYKTAVKNLIKGVKSVNSDDATQGVHQ